MYLCANTGQVSGVVMLTAEVPEQYLIRTCVLKKAWIP